ncbi:MAG: glycosyltransferase family 2 protein [Phycisphaerales bacterium]|nr:glycosyltransferase family 2 protein [Phycisphaerales bacterium]
MSLSVIIIAHNEAQDIEDCLRSVDFADEIIVVDSESTDETCTIAKKYTPNVHRVPWKGFGPQKNHALDLATGDWVLSLDCDERVSQELRTQLPAAMQQPDAAAYMVRFRSSYCGRFMRFGDWGGERKLRIFRRDAGRFDDAPVHEKIIIDGQIKSIGGTIDHYSVRSRGDMQTKAAQYADLGAQAAFDAGRTATSTSAMLRGVFAFLRGYILKGGIFDGYRGLTLAIDIASSTHRKHASLAKLCKHKRDT